VSNRATAQRFGLDSRGLRGAFLTVSAFLLASCLTGTPGVRTTEKEPPARVQTSEPRPLTVVLLAIDGVRWQEVFHGVDASLATKHRLGPAERVGARELMPNLYALTDGGGVLLGAPDAGGGVFASGPELVSLPGYAEMLSGRTFSGCRDNACGAATTPTLVDEIASSRGVRPSDVAVVTSWPDIGRIAAMRPDRIAMSTGRGGGPTRELFRHDPVAAALVDDAAKAKSEPGVGDFRPDRHTARIALRYLETARPRFLFLALGEPDEYAHRSDYRGYLQALRRADLVIAELSRALDDRARDGSRTVLFVTSDHGRAADFVNHGREHPESARVWLFAYGTEVLTREPLGRGSDQRLADLAPTLRVPFGLAEDRDPLAGSPIAGLLERPTE
jgi:hypothetical protein